MYVAQNKFLASRFMVYSSRFADLSGAFFFWQLGGFIISFVGRGT